MNERSRSSRLEIALVSTCATSTPPLAYGGTELVVAELARALVELGHRATVFATGDSTCAGELQSAFDHPIWPPDNLAELRHVAFAWREIASHGFDIVHVNHAVALPFATLVRRPIVATVHHKHVEALSDHYATYPETAYIAISQRQRTLSPSVPFRTVIHHGLTIDEHPAGLGDGGYCAYLGRFAREKGTHHAVDAARKAGIPLRLIGEPHPSEQDYFARELVPRFGHGADWLGELGGARKLELLRGACALLFPIEWEEPFGLVMIEAMLVGTPVIAFPRGSVPEVVDEGVTGFIVSSVDEMADRLHAVRGFDRHRCRRHARARWSSLRMAREYVHLYRQTIAATERVLHRTSRGEDGSSGVRTDH